MDEIEKKLHEKIRELVKNENLDLKYLSEIRIKYFAAVITRLLITEQINFDVVLGGGNSGLYMLKLTELVYDALGLPRPRFVCLPVVRNKRDPETKVESPFDNSVLLPEAKRQLEGIKEIKNILFVDDEIMAGTTSRSSIELVLKAVYGDLTNVHTNCAVVAEHHFFEWHHNTPYLSLRFFSNAKVIPGINNMISRIVPEDFANRVRELVGFGEIPKFNKTLSLLVAGALKEDKVDTPYYNFDKEKVLFEKLENYPQVKSEINSALKDLVARGVSEYKVGEIKFKF